MCHSRRTRQVGDRGELGQRLESVDRTMVALGHMQELGRAEQDHGVAATSRNEFTALHVRAHSSANVDPFVILKTKHSSRRSLTGAIIGRGACQLQNLLSYAPGRPESRLAQATNNLAR